MKLTSSRLLLLSMGLSILLGVFCFAIYQFSYRASPYEGYLKLPQLKIKHVNIEASSISDLKERLKYVGPTDLEGRHCYAFTKWRIEWHWPYDSQGQALLLKTKASFQAELSLPLWRIPPKASAADKAEWQRFYKTLRLHEAGHLKIVSEAYSKVAEAVIEAAQANPKLSEKQAQKIARQQVRYIRSLDLKYDTDTQNGVTQGVGLRS